MPRRSGEEVLGPAAHQDRSRLRQRLNWILFSIQFLRAALPAVREHLEAPLRKTGFKERVGRFGIVWIARGTRFATKFKLLTAFIPQG